MNKKNYKSLWLFGLILSLLLAIIFEIIFIELPSLEWDDIIYMELAKNFSASNFLIADQKPFRLGLIIPLYILIKIFGYSIFTYYLFSIGFLLSLFLVLLLLTKYLFGIKVAFISMILMISSSIILYCSTNIFPDIPAFFWAVSSLYLFLIYLNNYNKYILLVSAFFGFLTYLTKEPVTVFFITIPLIEYLKIKSLRKTIRYILIFALFIVCEMIIYFLISGDPFIRFKGFMAGVEGWKVYLPSVTVSEYLFASPALIFNYFSGKILIFGGLLGIIWAIIKRNFIVLSIFIGGLLIYILYTYSVVSFDPLIPSLPPSSRYIVGFLIVLNILTGWGIVTTSRYLAKKIKIKNVFIIFILFTTILSIFEIKERLGNHYLVFFNQDSYFVSDRILKDKILNNFNDIVYVTGGQTDVFQLFPNFKKLNLKPLSYYDEFPKIPFYVLYSRRSMQEIWRHANNKLYNEIENEKALEFLKKFRFVYSDQSPIIDYDEIVFSHISSNKIKYDTLFALNRMNDEKIFKSENDDLTFSLKNKSMVEVEFPKKISKLFHFCTFSTKNQLPEYKDTDIPNLSPLKTYIVEIFLSNKDYINMLAVNLVEYSSSKDILTHNIQSNFLERGDHQFNYVFKPSISAEKFKLTFEVKNITADNKLLIKNIVIYSCIH
jgi:hypothetical protein